MVFFKHRNERALNFQGAAMLGRGRIGGMMKENELPTCARCVEHAVAPSHLERYFLTDDMMSIIFLIHVFINKGG